MASTKPAIEAVIEMALAVASAAFLAYGVLKLDWSPFLVMAFFWAENGIIAATHLVRASASAFRRNADEFPAALVRIPIFALVFAAALILHGVAIILLFGDTEVVNEFMEIQRTKSPQRDGIGVWALAVWPLWHRLFFNPAGTFALAALASMHVVRTVGWLGATKSDPPPAAEALAGPWGRILVLHMALAACVVVVNGMGAPVAAVLMLVAVKLLYDICLIGWDFVARWTGAGHVLWSR